jgi:hypothetical protein
VFFNLDESGYLHLYDARETKGVQLVIPAGTVITPAADAGSTVKLRITNEIILVRKAVNYGTTSGWALKGEGSEEEPPAEETYTDIVLTFKNASSGYTFTAEDSANLLATYGAWKKLNVTVQEQYGNSADEAAAAELQEKAVFFNLDESGNLRCLFDHLLFGHFCVAAEVFKREHDVLQNGEMRIERVVLENQTDAAVFGRKIGDVVVPEEDLPGGRLLETADEVQHGALAASGRTEQTDEFAVGNFEREIVHRDDVFLDLPVPVGEFFRQIL